MNDTVIKNEQVNEQPNDSFFVDKGIQKAKKEEPSKNSQDETQYVSKGSNRKIDKPYNIHFQIGGGTFNNLITFVNEVNYDVAFLFRKREVFMIAIDVGNTHCVVVKFDKVEFTTYDAKGLETDESEKGIIIDISPIIEKMNIREEIPIDFYVDTVEMNRFYIVHGKALIERQLNSVNSSDGIDALLTRYRNFGLGTMTRLVSNTNYQKIVVNSTPLSNLIKALSKLTTKAKGETTLTSLFLTKYSLDWRVETEVDSVSNMLSGDDVVVYPLEEDRWKCNLEYFNKFGKMKLSYSVAMYICGNRAGNALPLIFETKLGGNGILVRYLVAPRVDE